MDAKNSLIEKACKQKWQKEQRKWLRDYQRLYGRKPGGVRKKWVFNEENGAYVVKPGKGGINWYRYQKLILVEKLFLFAKKYIKDRPNTQVVENNAGPHASKYQAEVYSLFQVMRILWPANSPNLNMIEPCWFWIKKETTRRGPTSSRPKLRARWEKCWEDLPQKKIQAWIERIPHHIQEVIRCKGGNEYKEGRKKGQEKIAVYS